MHRVSKNTVGWLMKTAGKKKYSILLLVVIQTIHGASGVLYALFLRSIVDCAVAKDQYGFWMNVLYVSTVVAAQLALRAVLRWLNELSRADIENVFKLLLMDNLLKKDYLAVSAVHSGEWLNRLTNDTVVVANGFVEIVPGLSGMIVKMLSAMIMIIVIDSLFALILIPGAVVMVILTYVFRKTLKSLHKNVQEKDGKLRIFLQESIGSMVMIRSFAGEEAAQEETQQLLDGHKAARMRKNRFSNICNIGFGVAMNGMYLLGIGYCAFGIMTGRVSYGTLTAISQLISQIQSPFANITGYLPKFYAMLASAERLMEIEGFDDENSDRLIPGDEVNSFYKEKLKSIGLSKVNFTYYPPSETVTGINKKDMPVVISNADIEIRKGEYTAFTGHSGCGKSTVIKLLMGLYRPDSGQPYICSTDESTRQLTTEWRRLFAYVPQGNMLMNGSIRDIVAFAHKEAKQDDERMMRALEIACAKDFVTGLENGADTILGERGKGLSEGQMQRLAIARAVFAESPVMILDEATSSLDSATEKQVLENLRKLTDKTVIIVTHRPAALEICDRILSFTENGIEETKSK